jgi:sortase A
VRRTARVAGLLLTVAGVLVLAWVVVVWRWEDPFTAIYTHIEQSHLAHDYNRRAARYRAQPTHGDLAAVEREIASRAAAYRASLRTGDPVGRLRIGRIGLNMVVVQGTDHDTLKKGPGHYEESGLPGEGHLVYVAGHRTTYLAPFADINDIRDGDYITFSLPYAAFTYRVRRHYVVPADAVGVLRDHGREILRLQACHPRFFATHRYIVDASLVSVKPRAGRRYAVSARAAAS